MKLVLCIAGVKVGVEVPDRYKGRFPLPSYSAFLTTDTAADVRLVVRTFPSPSNRTGSVFDPDRDYPILECAPAADRYRHRRADDLVILSSIHLIVLDRQLNLMEVYCFDTQRTPKYIGGHIFSLLACMLAERDGVLLHGVGFILSGVSGAVIGPSGAGKSTAVRLLEHDSLLSDDVVAVTGLSQIPILHATPLGGPTDGVMSAPMKALLFPTKGPRFSVDPIPPKLAFLRYWREHSDYLGRLFKPYAAQIFQNAHGLFHKVPSYELSFSRDYVDTEEIRRLLIEPGLIS